MLEKDLILILTEKITDLTRSNFKKIIESKNVKINNYIISSPSKKIKLNENIVEI